MKINEELILSLNLSSPSETSPIWTSSNVKVCTVKSDDGYTAKVTAVGQGKAEVVARANCDLGSGVQEHNTVFPVEVDDESVLSVPIVDLKVEESSYWVDKSL